jgi:hypothetical protein
VLDADLLSFIRGSIRSSWALELLLLVRKHRQRPFTPEELVLELRATPTLIKTCMEQLQNAGLVACDEAGGCRYAPASPAIDQLCDLLERAYGVRPVTIINAIVAPNDKLQDFADAFRFTKKDE